MDFFNELAEESFGSLNIRGNAIKKTKNTTVSKYVFDKEGETRLQGTYYAVNYQRKIFGNENFNIELSELIVDLIEKSTPKVNNPLVVGLGNSFVTSDSLGTQTINALIDKNVNKKTMLFKPSVYGLTKIECADVIKGLVEITKPDCVIAVDTLCCLDATRLYSHIQISNAGIIPGGGIGNPRTPLTFATLGVPVISIGIPLISYGENNLSPEYCVTPKEIDFIVKICSKIIADGLSAWIDKNSIA